MRDAVTERDEVVDGDTVRVVDGAREVRADPVGLFEFDWVGLTEAVVDEEREGRGEAVVDRDGRGERDAVKERDSVGVAVVEAVTVGERRLVGLTEAE